MNVVIESRTAAANKARMRRSEEKFAERLRERGWICIPPDAPLDELPTVQPWAIRGILRLDYGARIEE